MRQPVQLALGGNVSPKLSVARSRSFASIGLLIGSMEEN